MEESEVRIFISLSPPSLLQVSWALQESLFGLWSLLLSLVLSGQEVIGDPHYYNPHGRVWYNPFLIFIHSGKVMAEPLWKKHEFILSQSLLLSTAPQYYSCFSFFLFIYESERETLICWLTLQMPTMAGAGSRPMPGARSQECHLVSHMSDRNPIT